MRGNSAAVGRRLTGVNRIVVALLAALALVACEGSDDPNAGGRVASSGDSSIPEFDLSEPPVADAPDPADRAGAAADFVECEYGVLLGGWSMDFGWPAGAADPDSALLDFVDGGLFPLPTDGYVRAGRDDGRRLYTYSVDEVPRVAVIVADGADVLLEGEGGWGVETFASCDPAEYDPAADNNLLLDVWLDADSNRVLTSIISSRQGPDHCGWESVTFLSYGDRLFLGDPNGALADIPLVAPYESDTDLPSDATDTGYHHDDRHLWLSADGTVAYIVDDDNVEAWPTPVKLFGCA